MTHAPLGKNTAPKDTMVCKDHIFCLPKKYFLCFTNFTGDDDKVTEAVTEAVPKVVTEACTAEFDDNGR